MIRFILAAAIALLPLAVNAQGVNSGGSPPAIIAPGADLSADNVLMKGGTTQRPTAALASDQGLNVLAFGAKANAITFSDGTITTGTNSFCSSSATFSAADVGKTIQIDGAAGTTSAPLNTTVATFVSTHCITLAANATATTPLSYFSSATVVTGGSSGSYIPGETVTLTGGTSGTGAVAQIQDTLLHSATANAAGSGGTNGTCVVQGTTGAGTMFQVSTTISGGAISAIGSITNAGHYFTNPTSLSAEPVGNINGGSCAPTGATLTVVMWAETATVSTAGSYSVTPSNPVSTGAGSLSGATGLTLTAGWNAAGSYVYGSDDSAAFVSAINQSATNFAASGYPNYVYAPAGVYLIDVNTLPTMGSGLGIVGAGVNKTKFFVGASYSGDLFSWSEAWLINAIPFNGAMGQLSANKAGALAKGFSIWGNRRATAQQNALVFYDRDDEVTINDVDVYYLNGRCLYSGVTKNQAQAYMRESHDIGKIRCFNDGQAGVPVVEFNSQGSGDATNEIAIGEVDIYSPYGPGFVIRNNGSTSVRDMKINRLRVEGLEWNSANIASDLVTIGDPTLTGNVNSITIDQLEVTDPYTGFAGLRVTAPSAPVAPYFIRVGGSTGSGSGLISGGVPLGYGIKVDAGRSLYFHMAGISSWNTNFSIGATAGSPIVLDADQNESTLTYSINSPSSLYTPLRTVGSLGNPSGTAQATVSSLNTASGSSGVQEFTAQDPISGATISISMTHSAFPTASLTTTGAGGGLVINAASGGLYLSGLTTGTPTTPICGAAAGKLNTGPAAGVNCFLTTGATKFTTSGCAISATAGSGTVGTYTSGTSGTCTAVITMNGATGLTAPTGWNCSATDWTTTADTQAQTATSPTTATIAGTTVSGDVVHFACQPY